MTQRFPPPWATLPLDTATLARTDSPRTESTAQDAAADAIASHAVAALVDEVQLTPKPALVDRRGSGAHRDLDLARMLRSSAALRPTFAAIARAARGMQPSQALREHLGCIGRAGEYAMLAASGGSNTHRGAIWIVGLLAAGAAMINGAAAQCDTAARIARFDDRFAPAQSSNGKLVEQRFGVSGARGEARDGFPHVIAIGLPVLHACRAQQIGEPYARLNALLAIMTSLNDTCLLHRGGRAALDAAQAGARQVQHAGGVESAAGMRELRALHARLMALNASPGGSADLLAATLFLDRVGAAAERTSNAPAPHRV